MDFFYWTLKETPFPPWDGFRFRICCMFCVSSLKHWCWTTEQQHYSLSSGCKAVEESLRTLHLESSHCPTKGLFLPQPGGEAQSGPWGPLWLEPEHHWCPRDSTKAGVPLISPSDKAEAEVCWSANSLFFLFFNKNLVGFSLFRAWGCYRARMWNWLNHAAEPMGFKGPKYPPSAYLPCLKFHCGIYIKYLMTLRSCDLRKTMRGRENSLNLIH